MASNAIPTPSPQQIPAQHDAKKEETKVFTNGDSIGEPKSSWSSVLGLWAWNNDSKK
jgi:hypothetical protein